MALVVRKAKKVTYTTASGKKRTRKVILTKQEQRIADAYAQAISGLKGFTKSPQLYDNLRGLALGAGSVDTVVDSFDWAGFSMNLGDVPVTLLSQVSGEAGKQLDTLRTALGTDVTYSFDVTDPRAVAWAQVKTGELVTSVKESTREAIRQTIYEAINNGIDPMETAQRLTRVVGLLPRHASAVGKLYDNTLQRLVKDGVVEAEAKQKAREMADKYATRLVRYRAKMIARTEIQYANNMGRLLSWAEADNQGLLAGGLLKEWAVITPNSPYGKPCDVCAPMKGERVAWDKPFSNGLLMPPAHPHCRCTATPIVPTLDELRAMVQAKGVSPVSSDPFGFALQAEQLVQKHGDPSRPNYAALHPNSPAVKPDDLIPSAKEREALFNSPDITASDKLRDTLRAESHRLEKELDEENPYWRTDPKPEQEAKIGRVQALDRAEEDFRTGWIDRHLSTNGKPASRKDYDVRTRNMYVGPDDKTLAMNRGLRSGRAPSAQVKQIEAMVATGRVEMDTNVYRGTVLPKAIHENLVVGATFTDLAFQSTDMDKSTATFYAEARAKNGATGDTVMSRIRLKRGDTALEVGYGEVVLQRGTTMKITSRSVNDNGVILLDMEIV